MNWINIKIRLKSLLSVPFFLVLPLLIFSLSVEDLLSLSDKLDTVIVNRFLFVGLFSPLFLCPLLVLALHFFIHLEQANIKLQKTVGKIIIISFLLSLIISFVFSYGYGTYLKNNGFTQCRGIPSGSLPGMATKYAKSESFCYLK
ncbi:Uncharacterised protein [Yersinia mollaretii]|uniref:DUF1240 domain-containing protein n=1 Tax=Yersinia mollaretii TaxID=33060 RepID=UPI0005DC72DA|nr:DUF1240 domain-containing protein [Yersinia mollaretii]CNK60925.1 Uncharacterised protein [Yersinia mollaretii]